MELSLKNDIDSISNVKAHFTEILNDLKESQRSLIITQNGKSSGVLMDVGSFENLIKTIALLKAVNEGEESIKEKGTVSLSAFKSQIKKKYGF